MGPGAVRAGLRLVRPAVPLGRGAPLPAPLRAGRRLLPPLPAGHRRRRMETRPRRRRRRARRDPEDLARAQGQLPDPARRRGLHHGHLPHRQAQGRGEVDGDYRTKRVILEIYDAMAEAIRTGQPYQTRLDPPPADPRCCHPPREGKKS